QITATIRSCSGGVNNVLIRFVPLGLISTTTIRRRIVLASRGQYVKVGQPDGCSCGHSVAHSFASTLCRVVWSPIGITTGHDVPRRQSLCLFEPCKCLGECWRVPVAFPEFSDECREIAFRPAVAFHQDGTWWPIA